LLEEKFEAVAAIYIVHKEDTFAFDQSKLEDDICEEEFIDFGTANHFAINTG
jgi:hypothetical protein